jgi:hypothetical protein
MTAQKAGEVKSIDMEQMTLFEFAPIEAYRFALKPGTPVQVREDVFQQMFERGIRVTGRFSGTLQEFMAKPKRGQGFGMTVVAEVDSIRITHVGGRQIKGTAEIAEADKAEEEEAGGEE